MNRLTIIGNLTRDPQSTTTQAGKNVCHFTVAVNRRKSQDNQQPEADFFNVSAWNQMGESCQKYLAKGRKVAVVGSVSVRTYQAQDGTTRANLEVLAQDVEFLTPKGDAAESAGQAAPEQGGFTPTDVGDELPFDQQGERR